jgi:hypothetical protein
VPALRRLSRNVLVVGTVLAVTAAVGPLWMARVGLVVAVAAAVFAVTTAWREVAEIRQSSAADLLRVTRAHSAALREERRHNTAVLDTLTARMVRAASEAAQLRSSHAALEITVEKLKITVEKLTGSLSSARAELQRLRKEHEATSHELRRGQELIGVLRETVRSREAELEALSGPRHIRSIPRRVLAEHENTDHKRPDHDNAGPQPAKVTELVSEPVVLPNYEGDRKLA